MCYGHSLDEIQLQVHSTNSLIHTKLMIPFAWFDNTLSFFTLFA